MVLALLLTQVRVPFLSSTDKRNLQPGPDGLGLLRILLYQGLSCGTKRQPDRWRKLTFCWIDFDQ